MKKLSLILLLFVSSITFGQDQQTEKKESPYLEVLSENAVIPLKESNTEVNITGTIAHVKVTQVYHNEGTTAIEAKYVFPLSTQAAVHDMKMKVGERVTNAKIFEKQKAEEVYQEAVSEGKRAAKLDQARANVFQMKVGNVMPGDEISIEVYYTEMLSPTNGQYQFVAPSVVGPRFTGEQTNAETSFNNPTTKKGIADTFTYNMQVEIQAGMMIQNIESNTHKVNVLYPSRDSASIFLSKSNENPANRDFVLNYSLRGEEIASGLLLYEHNNEKFFAYMMEPPATVKPKNVTAREYLFIVDVSGSMNGYPLEVSKDLMRNLLCNLNADDTFNVQLFASSSTIFNPTPVEATDENVTNAIKFLTSGQGGGGTQLLSALNVAYELPRSQEGSSRSMVIITDGYVSVEREAFTKIEENLDQASVFTFGIGSSVNRYLIEGMAAVSKSESFIATSREEASKVAEDFKKYIDSPVMTQVKFETKGFDVYDVEPSAVPDIFAARPVVIFGKYKGEANGEIIMTGYQGRKKIKQRFKVSEGSLTPANKALRYLWARKKIEQLDDYNTRFNQDTKAEVIALGLQYNLATRFTSFVAVDEQVVNKDGSLKSVKQPLPMPKNVNNSAVGAAAEVKEKSVFKKTYTLGFNNNELPKAEARKVKMWFKAQYGLLAEKYTKEHYEFRLKFGENGQVISAEVFDGTTWIENKEILTAFKTLKIEALKTKKQFTILIRDSRTNVAVDMK
ncbi:von Willebrand factor type A like domain [unidentified eubacterium SCB49]|nr:von Willebrand factor type A like domain [unidentified eubacterium SCB49]